MSLITASSCHRCPQSCDDGNACTTDTCSEQTSYACLHSPITPCDGNTICEQGEFGRSSDCPSCDDGKPCTTDDFDVQGKVCRHEVQSPCCGNGTCEESEGLYECVEDCRTGIPTLQADKEYRVALKERYQFNLRQIELSSIWDNAIVADVILDTQNIGMRIDRGQTQSILGIGIRVLDVSYDLEPEKRSARIRVFSSTPEVLPSTRYKDAAAATHAPPVISDLVLRPGAGGVTVSWNVSEDADGIVNWGRTAEYGAHVSDFAFTRSHAIVVPLEETGDYVFAIRSCLRSVIGLCSETKGIPFVMTVKNAAAGTTPGL